MTNAITFVGCGALAFMLFLSILFAGPHLLLPATFMIVTVLIGGLCIYIATGMFQARAVVMRDLEKKFQADAGIE